MKQTNMWCIELAIAWHLWFFLTIYVENFFLFFLMFRVDCIICYILLHVIVSLVLLFLILDSYKYLPSITTIFFWFFQFQFVQIIKYLCLLFKQWFFFMLQSRIFESFLTHTYYFFLQGCFQLKYLLRKFSFVFLRSAVRHV